MKTPPLVAAAVCALLAAAPATADAKPRYKVSINSTWVTKEISDCKSTTNDSDRIKTTTTTTTKYSETGYFPGRSRRNGYRETKITTESSDPYVPTDEQTTKQEINEVFGADQWEIETTRNYLVYDFENEAGDIELVKFRKPRKGRSVTKTFEGTHVPERTSDARCKNSAEWTINETVTFKRVD